MQRDVAAGALRSCRPGWEAPRLPTNRGARQLRREETSAAGKSQAVSENEEGPPRGQPSNHVSRHCTLLPYPL